MMACLRAPLEEEGGMTTEETNAAERLGLDAFKFALQLIAGGASKAVIIAAEELAEANTGTDAMYWQEKFFRSLAATHADQAEMTKSLGEYIAQGPSREISEETA
jgi:hypothetical protein